MTFMEKKSPQYLMFKKRNRNIKGRDANAEDKRAYINKEDANSPVVTIESGPTIMRDGR
jgi:hypothetical protein